MTSFKTLLALSGVALLTACASPGRPGMNAPTPAKAEEHTQHHPAEAAAVPVPGMEARMKTMREMHDKMMKAKTPEERQALMAEHMKAMQDGMQMMKQMGGMGSMGGMGGMAGPGAGMKGMGPMPADSAKRQQMMEQRMDMMQTMMEMMMQRMPGAGMGTMPK